MKLTDLYQIAAQRHREARRKSCNEFKRIKQSEALKALRDDHLSRRDLPPNMYAKA